MNWHLAYHEHGENDHGETWGASIYRCEGLPVQKEIHYRPRKPAETRFYVDGDRATYLTEEATMDALRATRDRPAPPQSSVSHSPSSAEDPR
jgi:hypothetical protein